MWTLEARHRDDEHTGPSDLQLASRELGLEALLNPGVRLQTEEQTYSLCTFLAAYKHAHAVYLRSHLTLDLPPITQTTAVALCTTIHHATQLRRICIRNGDDIFLNHPELTKAIALLNHLEHLDVTSKQPSHTLLLALSDLQAKLVTIKLVFDTPYSSS